MPNARKKGLKLAGAFVEDEIDKGLAVLAKKHGFSDKASFLRSLFDNALQAEVDKAVKRGLEDVEGGKVRLTVKRTPTKPKRAAKGK